METKALTYAHIDINNLKENFNAVKGIVGDNVKIMSIIKADAYGHGAVELSKALLRNGADCFGVANVEEALEIRIKAGVASDIFILSGIGEDALPEIVKYRFTPIIYDLSLLEKLNKEAHKAKKRIQVHLKFDTSMGRLGFFPNDARKVFETALKLENIKVDGIMSHFSSADEEDLSYSKKQLTNFNDVLQAANELKINPTFKHIANSAGIINLKESHYNLVRPGIMLFGSTPSKKMADKIKLKPVMSIFSTIIQIKDFPKDSCISYSHSFTTQKESKIAVIPIGYADGYSRLLSNKGYVLLRNQKVPIVGNVTMDMTMIDVSAVPDAKVGDTVTVLGEEITAWDLAELTNTISYEILTGIYRRVKRNYSL